MNKKTFKKQLREILTNAEFSVESSKQYGFDDGDKENYVSEITNLVLEMIGEDEVTEPSFTPSPGDERNRLRALLRSKLLED